MELLALRVERWSQIQGKRQRETEQQPIGE